MSSPDRVEFVDTPAVPGDDADVVEVGGGGPGGRWSVALVAAAVLVLLGALFVARVAGDDGSSATPVATATPAPLGRPTRPVTTPVFGLVGLPRAISAPRELVAARSGDVVWMLDRGAGIVRIENGTVTAVQLLESQATAIAVNPDGTRLYVATAANRPSIQALDARTLALGPSQALDGSISALTVSLDAVWAATGDRLLRLDTDSLDTLDTVELPGVVVTDHLRMQAEQAASSNQQYVVGLVTGGPADEPTVTRFVRVDPLTREVRFGPVLPGVTTAATAPLLTWVTTSDAVPVTAGYASVLDSAPTATATPALAAGSRIYDGGGGFAAFLVVAPDSSVIGCRDPGGFRSSEVDVAPTLPGAVVSGQVLRTDTAFYAVTDRGLVRTGVGACG